MLIEGDPGAGKTVLAATICYANAVRERPCLYVSLRERWEVFREEMLHLGMNFEELRALHLFRYVRLPIIASTSMFNAVSKIIAECLSKIKPKVIVIDDVKLITNANRLSVHKARSIIQNFLYDLSSIIKGVTILVASWGAADAAMAKELEHAADIVLELRMRTEEGTLKRSIVVKKVRGNRVPSWSLPFRIVDGLGIKVTVPIDVEEVTLTSGEVIPLPCSVLNEVAGGLCRGCLMLVSYPPDGRCHKCVYLPVMLMVALGNLKTAIVSFRKSSNEMRGAVTRVLTNVGLDEDLANELIIYTAGANPVLLGLNDILELLDDILRNHYPDVLILHGVEVLDFLYEGSGRITPLLYNLAIRARKQGSSIIIFYGRTHGSTYEVLSALSSIVLRLEYVREGESVKPQLYVWGSGNVARILGLDELQLCVDEGIKSLSFVGEPAQLSKDVLKWREEG